jgi:hypothetical protein
MSYLISGPPCLAINCSSSETSAKLATAAMSSSSAAYAKRRAASSRFFSTPNSHNIKNIGCAMRTITRAGTTTFFV